MGIAFSLEEIAKLAFAATGVAAATEETVRRSDLSVCNLQRAARLWGVAQTLREEMGVPLTQALQEKHDEKIAEARQALGEADWAMAWEQGCQLPLEQALTFALQGNEEG